MHHIQSNVYEVNINSIQYLNPEKQMLSKSKSLALSLMALLSGCSLGGGFQHFNMASPASVFEGTASCASCQSSSWSGFLCSHGMCCYKKKPKYSPFVDGRCTSSEARSLAKTCLREASDRSCQDCDYNSGFVQAFVDVSQGADGETPALPPANYWKNCARTPEGHAKAERWFQGYAEGGARARQIYDPYNQVAHSQMMQESWAKDSPN
ncbi:hypothetical protein SH668x_000293 [Planctomicrobium sp. SH668]|uniref:hypothetical protein n=1 Tax=Planctomicrobium sp. SH668 TaxID=3448126 RepID=UPI003F5B0828